MQRRRAASPGSTSPPPGPLVTVISPPCRSDDGARERQAEPGAAALARRVGAVEAVEDALAVLGRDARAVVAHLEDRPRRRPCACRPRRERPAPRVLDGVLGQVEDDAEEQRGAAARRRAAPVLDGEPRRRRGRRAPRAPARRRRRRRPGRRRRPAARRRRRRRGRGRADPRPGSTSRSTSSRQLSSAARVAPRPAALRRAPPRARRAGW